MRVEDCLEPEGEHPDLFDEDLKSYFHVPCGDCAHRQESAEFCMKCRHYIR